MPETPKPRRFELSANCAMTAREASLFFIGVASVSLLVAIGFTLMGFWPVLPFAGLELGLLGWAIRHTWLRAQSREFITIDEDEIVLERVDANGESLASHSLPRLWTQVRLIRDRRNPRERRLAFSRKGRSVVFGDFLIESEKRTLLRRLREVLRETT